MRRAYAMFSQAAAIAAALGIAANLVAAGVFALRDWRVHRAQSAVQTERVRARVGQPRLTEKRDGYQMLWVDLRSYEGVPSERVDQVLDDFFTLGQAGFAFEAHTHFSEAALATETLNFRRDESGHTYRARPSSGPSPRERPFLLYAFGGSSTLGWNVADDWTIPYYLERELQRRHPARQVVVRNYGRSNYSWFQEMVLFQELLAAGHRPDAAIFLDGINVYNVQGASGAPQWTPTLQALWDDAQFLPSPLPDAVPVFRALNALARRRVMREHGVAERHPPAPDSALNPQAIRDSYLRTSDQIAALAAEYGVAVHQFWQPNRAFRCTTERYSQPLPEDYVSRSAALYETMESVTRPNFSSLARLCERVPHARIFIDDVHYSPAFNQVVAREIASRLHFPSL